MDSGAIAAASTAMATQQTMVAAQTSLLKQVQDLAEGQMAQLMQGLVSPVPPAEVTPIDASGAKGTQLNVTA